MKINEYPILNNKICVSSGYVPKICATYGKWDQKGVFI